MTTSASGRQRPAVQRFWLNYLSVLEQSSVPERARPYYRKAVEAYISANRGRRLANHRAADVEKYLTATGGLSHLHAWQFRQIIDALRLLFMAFLQLPWAQDFDWNRWRIYAATLQNGHAR